MATFKRYAKRFNTAFEIYPGVVIEERETDLYVEYNIEDKLETLASRVYNDPALWWIIMLANPEYVMEFDITPGETLRVPLPLNAAISDINKQTS